MSEPESREGATPPGGVAEAAWAAVVLAGGRARRLGGVDKPGLMVAGQTLLDRVVWACGGARPVVVVGPRRPTEREVCWQLERPRQAGPVAALAAGLAALPPTVGLTAVLASDLPGLRPQTMARLLAAVGQHDGALLVDESGRRQWLCGVWRTAALRAALAAAGDPEGKAVRAVLGSLDPAELVAWPGEAADIDTPGDLRAVTAD